MLESLITSKAKRKVLALFFTNPKSSFYVREVCRKTGEQPNAVRAELGKLEAAGILLCEQRGNSLFYRVNPICPIYQELKGIILKTEGIGSALRGAVGKLNARFAFIYGSYAKGEERSGSDIDVMIIGKVLPEEVASTLRACEKQIGREINYSIYPEGEFLKGRENGFIAGILKGKKIMLLGAEDELERFAL
jgi:predicted nucleotidyltransferase/predicted transcriptional regulator with HTH domain